MSESFEKRSNRSTQGKHVFIAYRVTAKDVARKMAWYLTRNKIDVWFFPWKVGWGDSVTAEEEKGLDNSFAGLIIFTPDFLEGRTATEEYRALAAKRREDLNFKLGLLRVDCSRELVPPFLKDYFDVEVSSGRDPRFFDEAAKILRGILGLSLEPFPSNAFSIDLVAYNRVHSHLVSILKSKGFKRYSPETRRSAIRKLQQIIEMLLSGVDGFIIRSRVRAASNEFDYVITNRAMDPFLARLDLRILVEWEFPYRDQNRKLLQLILRDIAVRASRLGTGTVILFYAGTSTKGMEIYAIDLCRRQGLYMLAIDLKDLKSVAGGRNFVSILESKHAALTLGLK